MNSVEIRTKNATAICGAGRLTCDLGDISETIVHHHDRGVLQGVGPLVIFSADIAEETDRFGRYGVTQTVVDDIITVVAKNGTWIWRLLPAHWAQGHQPPEYVDNILLGRWPD